MRKLNRKNCCTKRGFWIKRLRLVGILYENKRKNILTNCTMARTNLNIKTLFQERERREKKILLNKIGKNPVRESWVCVAILEIFGPFLRFEVFCALNLALNCVFIITFAFDLWIGWKIDDLVSLLQELPKFSWVHFPLHFYFDVSQILFGRFEIFVFDYRTEMNIETCVACSKDGIVKKFLFFKINNPLEGRLSR